MPTKKFVRRLGKAPASSSEEIPSNRIFFRDPQSFDRYDHLLKIFSIPNEGVNIFNIDFDSFDFPPGESKFTASALIRRTPNRAFVFDTRTKVLNSEAYLLAMYIFYSFLPKGGDHDHVRGSVPLLIYCLMKPIRVNLPLLMLETIVEAGQTSRNIPYGCFFTKIFKHFGVPLHDKVFESPTNPFGSRIISNMQKLMRDPIPGTTSGEEEEEEEAGEEEESEEEEYESSSMGARMARLEKNQEELSTYVHEIGDYVHEEFGSIHGKLDALMDHFHIWQSRKKRGP